MLLTFSAFLVLSAACFGLGLALWWGVARLAALPPGRPLWGELGLMGLFVFGTVGVLWNFLLPIRSAFAVCALALGLIVLLVSSLRSAEQRASLVRIAVAGVVPAAALAVLVGFTPLGYDAGLYHLPAQLWLRSGPAVIGLSNFHYRLGLNSIVEPISAALWLRGNLVLVGVADALFLLFYLLSLVQHLQQDAERTMTMSAAFALLSPLSLLLFTGYFLFQVGLNDVPAAMLALACLFAFVRAFETRGERSRRLVPLATLCVLAAFAMTVKLSSGALAVLPAIALLAFRSGPPSRRQWAAIWLSSGALALPAIARGVWLSGCLLFPVAGSCLSALPWASRSDAEYVTRAVRSWSRAPGTGQLHAQDWAWLPDWWTRWRGDLLSIVLVTLAVAMVAVGLRLALRHADRPVEGQPATTTEAGLAPGLVVFGLASLALWFFGGPHPRYGSAALHTVTIVPGLLLFARPTHTPALPPKLRRALGTSGVVLISLLCLELAVRSWPRSVDAGALLSVRLGTPTVEVVPNRHFGVHPATGDQCWLTSSPCSPTDPEISVARRRRWLIMEPLSRER